MGMSMVAERDKGEEWVDVMIFLESCASWCILVAM